MNPDLMKICDELEALDKAATKDWRVVGECNIQSPREGTDVVSVTGSSCNTPGLSEKWDQWNRVNAKTAVAARNHLPTLIAAARDAVRLHAQLPDGMKHCTILAKQCKLGHAWLTATNWLSFECPTCERDRLRGLLARAYSKLDRCTYDILAKEIAAEIATPDVKTPGELG